MVADLELESFKRLNLSEVAASLGYRIDFRASSRNCAVMVQDDGDKIIVTACPDGHFVYFSVRDDRDNGTVIDFVQRRRGGTIGHIRRFLRDWIGSGHNVGRAPAGTFATSLIPIPRDVAGVRASFLRMTALPIECAYLSEVRAIPEWLLSHTSVEESVRVDSRGNACFAHHNADGLCGYEIKNRGFTGFASGGVKGLWIAGDNETATTLAVSETALDSLSYAAIHGIAGVRLASVAGQMNPDQPKLLRSAMQQLPTGGRVVSAMDRDAGGDALTARVLQVYTELGRTDLQFVDHRPITPGTDWNDELRTRPVPPDAPHPG